MASAAKNPVKPAAHQAVIQMSPEDLVSAVQNMNARRSFLKMLGGAVAAVGAETVSSPLVAAAWTVPPMPPVAVFGKIFQQLKLDFQQSAEVAVEAELDGVDCAVRSKGEIQPERASALVPRYAEALAKHGLRMPLLTTDIQGVDSPHARDVVQAGLKAGARYYRLGPWLHRPEVPAAKLAAEIIAKLKDLAPMNRELGACGLLQNHSSWNGAAHRPAGGDLGELYRLVKDFDPHEIGVAFDLGHALIVHGDGWREHYEKLRPHIRVVYVKDTKRGAGFVPFGQGDFARTGFFAALARSGYRAPMSLHIEYPWAVGGKKTRVELVQTLRRSRRALQGWWEGK
jgi:sugar phosphate isomerase/epimerase